MDAKAFTVEAKVTMIPLLNGLVISIYDAKKPVTAKFVKKLRELWGDKTLQEIRADLASLNYGDAIQVSEVQKA